MKVMDFAHFRHPSDVVDWCNERPEIEIISITSFKDIIYLFYKTFTEEE